MSPSLDWSCEVCRAKAGEPCVWPLTRTDGVPVPHLTDSGEHFARIQPPGQSKVPEQSNEMGYE